MHKTREFFRRKRILFRHYFYICTLFGIKLEKMREGSLQNHVIATAQKLFYKEGVRAVTMDKVAQSLRMS